MTEVPHDALTMLWTGGWDSSYRLLHLVLVERRAVRPVYLLLPDRDSMQQELAAMDRMRRGLVDRGAGALLAPTLVVVATDHPPAEDLRAAYERLLAGGYLGTQYLQLAAVAEALGWSGVEMCVDAAQGSALGNVLEGDGAGGLRDPDAARLFSAFSFPVREMGKPEMARRAAQDGFLDLLSQRWSCHSPVLGMPCGRCRPCGFGLRDSVQHAPAVLAVPALQWHRVRRVLVRRVQARQA